MPSNIGLSRQHALNRLQSNSNDTTKSDQAVFNSANGSNGKSLQEILNTNLGNASPTAKSVQQCLFQALTTSLSLTGPATKFSEQELINMALNNGSVTLQKVIGK